MKKVAAAVKLVLDDVSKLQGPTIAAAVAAVVVPVVAKIAGADVTVPEVTGWLVLAGGVAATLEKIASGKAEPAKQPPAAMPPAVPPPAA